MSGGLKGERRLKAQRRLKAKQRAYRSPQPLPTRFLPWMPRSNWKRPGWQPPAVKVDAVKVIGLPVERKDELSGEFQAC